MISSASADVSCFSPFWSCVRPCCSLVSVARSFLRFGDAGIADGVVVVGGCEGSCERTFWSSASWLTWRSYPCSR